jgi:hypothetical protein
VPLGPEEVYLLEFVQVLHPCKPLSPLQDLPNNRMVIAGRISVKPGAQFWLGKNINILIGLAIFLLSEIQQQAWCQDAVSLGAQIELLYHHFIEVLVNLDFRLNEEFFCFHALGNFILCFAAKLIWKAQIFHDLHYLLKVLLVEQI